MKKLFHKIAPILIMTVAGGVAVAQTLSVDVPKVVEESENFRLIFTVLGVTTAFNPPAIHDFEILAGPSPSSMSRTEIVNGNRTDISQTSYTYILLPKGVGTFTIPAASVVVDGKEIYSQPVQVEVVKGSDASRQDRTGTTVSNEDIFLRISVSKSRVVKGESLVATIKLYSSLPVVSFNEVIFPTFNGFWSQELETPQSINFERESVDGSIYNAALIRRYLLLPQQSGTLSIEPMEIVCELQMRSTPGAARSIFDSFFESYQIVRKRVIAPVVRITVDPLPEGAPASFSGGVGDFDMSVSLTRDSLNANEALSLIVNISGSGNINLLEAPKVEFPNDFEVYDMKTSSGNRTGGTSGSKRFEYPLIPRSSGTFKIPEVEFSYYNISRKQYITLRSKELEIKVGRDMGGATSSQGVVMPGVNRQAVRSFSDDVRYIDTKSSGLKRGNYLFFASPSYFGVVSLTAILFIIAERLLSKRIKRNRDIAGVKNRRANKVAKGRLKNAESLLKQGLYTGFYEELHRALLGYISDKLNLSIADLSKDNIEGELRSKQVRTEHIGELLSLLDRCEYARYAPDPGGGQMDDSFERAIKLISEMEL